MGYVPLAVAKTIERKSKVIGKFTVIKHEFFFIVVYAPIVKQQNKTSYVEN